MHNQNQVINSDAEEWINSFQDSIASLDTKKIHLLLHVLPAFKTEEEMRRALLLTMDAEVLLCDMRQELVNQRNDLTTYLKTIKNQK